MAVIAIEMGSNLAMLMISGVMMLVSATAGIINFTRERKKYRTSLTERENIYHSHLAACSRDLEVQRQSQLLASLTPHPDPTICLERAFLNDPERRLWERSPADPDFLDLRLGVGLRLATYNIKFAESASDRMNQDALSRKAKDLVKEYASVEGSAISVPLGEIGVLGCAGSQQAIQQIGRILILQLATHHAPNEVKLVLVFPETEKKDWDWARWLPHLWNEDHSHRMIADNPRTASGLLTDLSQIFSGRQLELRKSSKPEEVQFRNHYVFIFADPKVIDEAGSSSYGKLFAMLMSEGRELGASTILLQNSRQKLDRACRAVVDLNDASSLYLTTPKPETIAFTLDTPDTGLADRLARSLASIRIKIRSQNQGKGGDLPKNKSIFELLAISRPEDLPLQQNWTRVQPYVSLNAPIGVQAEGLTYFNLQEVSKQGLGPHAVIGGMTGTGKTKGLLHTIILSMAIHNHPHDLNFLLVDYKGGDLYRGLETLPHVVGCLGNLAGAQKQSVLVRRLFTCLEAELKRRRNLLGNSSINDYHAEQFKSGENKGEILPHLVVIIDEFAELISKNTPDVVELLKSNLVSIARTGRSLGVHLVLATQDPGNVVRGDIRDAVNLILCLGMGTRDASREMLETEDAYIENLGKQQGRGYIKAKRESLFAQFQSAFSGFPASFIPTSTFSQKKISEMNLMGISLQELVSTESVNKNAASEINTAPLSKIQSEALAVWIGQQAEENKIQKMPNPFLPLLPDQVEMETINVANEGWNGHSWPASSNPLNPLIGLADDPANLKQFPIRLNLGRDGHLAVYGRDGNEMAEFLSTLILSMAFDLSPEQLHIYVMDFEGQRLTDLKSLPHMGDMILAEEKDRALRLLGFLRRELKRRKASAGMANKSDSVQTDQTFPKIVLVLNNYSQFEAASDLAVESLIQLLDQGASQYGIHLIVSGNRSSAISRRVTALSTLAVSLELNPNDDISMIIGRMPGLTAPASIKGRAILRGVPALEFQTGRWRAHELIRQMAQAWQGSRPPSTPTLNGNIALRQLLVDSRIETGHGYVVPVGLHAELMDAVHMDLKSGPYFMVSGRAQGGKTTFIQSWLLGLASKFSRKKIKFYFINIGALNQRLFILRNLPHSAEYADSEESLSNVIRTLSAEIAARRTAFETAVQNASNLIDENQFASQFPALVIVMDDYEQTANAIQQGPLRTELELLFKQGNRFGLYGLLSAPAKELYLNFSSDPVVKLFKDSQSGAIFDRTDQHNLLSNSSPKTIAGTLSTGHGFLVNKGSYTQFQAAWAGGDGTNLSDWVEKIKNLDQNK